MTCPITTHVLDTSRGCPAAGIPVQLIRIDGKQESPAGSGVTDSDGRIMTGLIEASEFAPGKYLIRFDTQAYFDAAGIDSFYPEVSIVFTVSPGNNHYHVPLLLSPFGYTTYRGS